MRYNFKYFILFGYPTSFYADCIKFTYGNGESDWFDFKAKACRIYHFGLFIYGTDWTAGFFRRKCRTRQIIWTNRRILFRISLCSYCNKPLQRKQKKFHKICTGNHLFRNPNPAHFCHSVYVLPQRLQY